jgi:hypothetical protein
MKVTDSRKEDMRRYYQKNKRKLIRKKKAFQSSPEGKLKRQEWNRNYREKTKLRKKAYKALENAIKSGKVKPCPCEICGKKAGGHHEDYSKPLEVRWLCPQHHKDVHRSS